MKNNVVARELVDIFGIGYHIELRKEKNFEGRTIYRLYNVYDLDIPVCEEPRGCAAYFDLDEAIAALEKVTGVKFEEEYKRIIELKANSICEKTVY